MKIASIGLRTTILVTITMVMITTMLLISFVVLTITKKTVIDQKVHAVDTMLFSLRHFITLAGSTVTSGSSFLNPLLDENSVNAGVQDFIVVDSSLRVTASGDGKSVGQRRTDRDLLEAIKTQAMIKTVKPIAGKDHLVVTAPLPDVNGRGGAIRCVLSMDDVENIMAAFQKVLLLFSISTVFAFAIIGSFLLSRYLVKPLDKLIRSTEAITERYVPHNLEGSSSNEIGTLFLSLSRMSDKLREDKAAIENYISSLEQSNRELQRAQDEVIRSEKLSSVGKLAAGVAHEIGNPIGIILGYLEILGHDDIAATEKDEMIRRLQSEVMRIDSTIRELLAFSRPCDLHLHPVQVNSVIEAAASLISHQKDFKKIRLALHLDSLLPPIMADEHQFQQVMVNLLINAVDAMPEGGSLSVSTRRERCDRGEHASLPREHGVVLVTVRDTGHGIEADKMTKIFDPFYTTKSPGKGTGLGLSVSLRIVESFGGTISVESSRTDGTTFSLILPALEDSKTAFHAA